MGVGTFLPANDSVQVRLEVDKTLWTPFRAEKMMDVVAKKSKYSPRTSEAKW